MALTRLWSGIRTRNKDNAGTHSQIVLIINNNINDNGSVDVLHHTFEADTAQDDLERGKANLYEVPLAEPLNITYTVPTNPKPYIRVGIRGEDAWHLEDFFVFGEENGSPIPMALATNIPVVLSNSEEDKSDDGSSALLSIPIPPIRKGGPANTMTHLLVLMLTSADGTNNPNHRLQLRLESTSGGLFADFDMPPFPPEGEKQDHQKANEANFYYTKADKQFTKNDLLPSANGSITLTLGGSDSWLPERFFVFGIVNRDEVPEALIPLVYIPDWTLGPLISGDPPTPLPLAP